MSVTFGKLKDIYEKNRSESIYIKKKDHVDQNYLVESKKDMTFTIKASMDHLPLKERIAFFKKLGVDKEIDKVISELMYMCDEKDKKIIEIDSKLRELYMSKKKVENDVMIEELTKEIGQLYDKNILYQNEIENMKLKYESMLMGKENEIIDLKEEIKKLNDKLLGIADAYVDLEKNNTEFKTQSENELNKLKLQKRKSDNINADLLKKIESLQKQNTKNDSDSDNEDVIKKFKILEIKVQDEFILSCQKSKEYVINQNDTIDIKGESIIDKWKKETEIQSNSDLELMASLKIQNLEVFNNEAFDINGIHKVISFEVESIDTFDINSIIKESKPYEIIMNNEFCIDGILKSIVYEIIENEKIDILGKEKIPYEVFKSNSFDIEGIVKETINEIVNIETIYIPSKEKIPLEIFSIENIYIERKKRLPYEIFHINDIHCAGKEKDPFEMVTNSELEIKSKDKIPYEISLLNSFNIEGKIRNSTIDIGNHFDINIMGKIKEVIPFEIISQLVEIKGKEKLPYEISSKNNEIEIKGKDKYHLEVVNNLNLIEIIGKERIPYKVVSNQVFELKAKEKIPFEISQNGIFNINGKEKSPLELSNLNEITIEGTIKEISPYEVNSSHQFEIKRKEKIPNQINTIPFIEIKGKDKKPLVINNNTSIEIKSKEKIPFEITHFNSINIEGKIHTIVPFEIYSNSIELRGKERASFSINSSSHFDIIVPIKQEIKFVIDTINISLYGKEKIKVLYEKSIVNDIQINGVMKEVIQLKEIHLNDFSIEKVIKGITFSMDNINSFIIKAQPQPSYTVIAPTIINILAEPKKQIELSLSELKIIEVLPQKISSSITASSSINDELFCENEFNKYILSKSITIEDVLLMISSCFKILSQNQILSSATYPMSLLKSILSDILTLSKMIQNKNKVSELICDTTFSFLNYKRKPIVNNDEIYQRNKNKIDDMISSYVSSLKKSIEDIMSKSTSILKEYKEVAKYKKDKKGKDILEVDLSMIDNETSEGSIGHIFYDDRSRNVYKLKFINSISDSVNKEKSFSLFLSLLILPKLTHISFSNCTVEQQFISFILNTILYVDNISSLSIKSSSLNDESLNTLLQSLITNKKNLYHLNISNNSLTSVSGDYLINYLKSNPTLSSLNLSHNTINENGLHSFISYLQTSNHHFSKLSLGYNNLINEEIFLLSSYLRSNPNIEYIDISGNEMSMESAIWIGDTISSITKAKKIKMCGMNITGEMLTGIFKSGSINIKEIILDDNNFGDIGNVSLSKLLMMNTSIEKLSIKNTMTNSFGVDLITNALMMNSNTAIKEIHLENNTLDLQSLEKIISFCEKKNHITFYINKSNCQDDEKLLKRVDKINNIELI